MVIVVVIAGLEVGIEEGHTEVAAGAVVAAGYTVAAAQVAGAGVEGEVVAVLCIDAGEVGHYMAGGGDPEKVQGPVAAQDAGEVAACTGGAGLPYSLQRKFPV